MLVGATGPRPRPGSPSDGRTRSAARGAPWHGLKAVSCPRQAPVPLGLLLGGLLQLTCTGAASPWWLWEPHSRTPGGSVVSWFAPDASSSLQMEAHCPPSLLTPVSAWCSSGLPPRPAPVLLSGHDFPLLVTRLVCRPRGTPPCPSRLRPAAPPDLVCCVGPLQLTPCRPGLTGTLLGLGFVCASK